MRPCVLSLLGAFLALPAPAQDVSPGPLSFALGIKQPDDGPNMPNLRLTLERRGIVVDESFTSVRRWRVRGRLDLTTRAPMNPDDSFAEVAFGLVKPWLDPSGRERLVFGVYADARGESNQTASELLASMQGRLIISHLRRRGPWLLVPQVELALGITWAAESRLHDAIGVEPGANARVDAEAHWSVPFRAFATGLLAPLTFDAALRGFRTSGVDAALEALGQDEGGHASVTAAYGFVRWGLTGVFVRWSRGRLPAQPVLTGAWSVGLAK